MKGQVVYYLTMGVLIAAVIFIFGFFMFLVYIIMEDHEEECVQDCTDYCSRIDCNDLISWQEASTLKETINMTNNCQCCEVILSPNGSYEYKNKGD